MSSLPGYLLAFIVDMIGLTIPVKSLRYLLAIHKIYDWPHQHWRVLNWLLGIHRRYGWHQQPWPTVHVIPWYPYEIWLVSDAYLVISGDIAGITRSNMSVWSLIGIQRR